MLARISSASIYSSNCLELVLYKLRIVINGAILSVYLLLFVWGYTYMSGYEL